MAIREPAASLWRHPDFLRLWAGQSVSEIGSVVATVALPLVAVVTLRVSVLQVGLLSAAGTLPFFLFALPAGLVVDSVDKRRLMIGCDAGRMLVIGSVPAAYAMGALTVAQLYAVALLSGALTVFFDVAYQAYLPSLIGREQLTGANGWLSSTQSLAQTVGPSLGGLLYALLKAGALTADAASFAASWISLLAIRSRQQPPEARQSHLSRAALLSGLAFVMRHPVIRRMAACTATANLFNSMAYALIIVFMIRVLGIRPAWTGLFLAVDGGCGILAAVSFAGLSRRLGLVRLAWLSMLTLGFAGLLLPLAAPGWRLVLLAAGLGSTGARIVLFSTSVRSYCQSACPAELLGRMSAAMRWIVWSTLPLGGLLGGLLGSTIGIRATMWTAMTGSCAASAWLLARPVLRLRDRPGRPARAESLNEPA